MNSIILQIASKHIRVILLFFAILALLRGHNHPGGGFIGGLLAALAVVFNSFAFSLAKAREQLKIQPQTYMAIGLGLILMSFLPAWIQAEPVMSGNWFAIDLPLSMELKLGTPLLFDTGVFMAVIGVTLMFLFTLRP